MIKRSRSVGRAIIGGLTVAAAFIALSGCTSPAPAGEDATITFMTFETPAITPKFWDDSIASALESVPGLKVNRIVTPDLDRTAYAKQLQASGQFPDVLASINVKEFIEAELLMPYDQAWLDANFLEPNATAIGGKTYMPPSNAQVLPMVFYNKTIFAANNVEVPTTWSEFLAAVKTFAAAGVTPIELAGLDTWSASMPVVALASADVLGDDPNWIQERISGTVKFSDANFVAAMQKGRDLVEAGAYSDSALSVDYGTANTNFFEGKSAMYIMGSWLVGQFPAETVEEFGSFAFPTNDGAIVVPLAVGGTTVVSAKSPHADKAMEFAKAWTLDTSGMKVLIESDGAFPLIKGRTIADYGATVTGLYDEAYAFAAGDALKVAAFAWANNDDALPAGMGDKFQALSQAFFSNGDIKSLMAQLDADWDASVGG